jgi:hypothetical protein
MPFGRNTKTRRVVFLASVYFHIFYFVYHAPRLSFSVLEVVVCTIHPSPLNLAFLFDLLSSPCLILFLDLPFFYLVFSALSGRVQIRASVPGCVGKGTQDIRSRVNTQAPKRARTHPQGKAVVMIQVVSYVDQWQPVLSGDMLLLCCVSWRDESLTGYFSIGAYDVDSQSDELAHDKCQHKMLNCNTSKIKTRLRKETSKLRLNVQRIGILRTKRRKEREEKKQSRKKEEKKEGVRQRLSRCAAGVEWRL